MVPPGVAPGPPAFALLQSGKMATGLIEEHTGAVCCCYTMGPVKKNPPGFAPESPASHSRGMEPTGMLLLAPGEQTTPPGVAPGSPTTFSSEEESCSCVSNYTTGSKGVGGVMDLAGIEPTSSALNIEWRLWSVTLQARKEGPRQELHLGLPRSHSYYF